MNIQKQILVIDDELSQPAAAESFREAYTIDGFEYRFVSNEKETLETLRNDGTIVLILLDIRFEGIGEDHGLKILEHLIHEGYTIPVIMISSISASETIIRAWDLGAEGYIVKWDSNPRFDEELKGKVVQHALLYGRKYGSSTELYRTHLSIRTRRILKDLSQLNLDDFIDAACTLKEEIQGEWRHSIPLSDDFENYVRGWNAPDALLKEAEREKRLLYINMDFGDGCTLHCPHCFTQEGAIDARGRDPLPYEHLKEAMLDAKKMGLLSVRILGRGEPTQWIAGGHKGPHLTPRAGEDFLDFVEFLSDNDIIPVIFTRGQIIGNDDRVRWAYGGAHGIENGVQLVERLYALGATIFLGFSSLFPEINNEMVGRPATELYNYDTVCLRALKLCMDMGFNEGNPTRLAVEAPITNLNIREMLVRYILFQMLNISPCSNVYMVTGRAMTYGLREITDPGQDAFLDMYATITRAMERMGIGGRIGPYAGTKKCHDVSNGLYLTLNGDVYPCPGYEGLHNMIGSLRNHSMDEIWENSIYGGHPQSICPPKIATHFPPDFEDQVKEKMAACQDRYDRDFEYICERLGIEVK